MADLLDPLDPLNKNDDDDDDDDEYYFRYYYYCYYYYYYYYYYDDDGDVSNGDCVDIDDITLRTYQLFQKAIVYKKNYI